MFAYLSNFLQKKQIELFAPVPLSACKIRKPYLLDRAGISDGTVVMILVPYYTPVCDLPSVNLSAYAIAEDYHRFFAALFDELLPQLQERFPSNRFAGFTDHSPIDEIHAASRAGLGVIGKNGLLLTQPYSSYVFLGELITDRQTDVAAHPVTFCENCGACRAACPAPTACLSALTQKKGELTEDEIAAIRNLNSVWGCDICQAVCPHTIRAKKNGTIFSPIPYFSQQTTPHLTSSLLRAMSDEEFEKRAYAWRGRSTIERNLRLFEKGDGSC